jgi:hypothetical protein
MIAAPSAAERDGPPGQAADLRQRGDVQPGLPRTFAEIARETNVLSQELTGSGELASVYGVAGQVNAQVVQAADGGPVVTAAPAPRPGSTQMRSQIQGPGIAMSQNSGSPPFVRHITRRSGRPGTSSASSRRRDRSAAVRAAGAGEAAGILARRAAGAGMFGVFLAYHSDGRDTGGAVSYRHGCEPDLTPAPPWRWTPPDPPAAESGPAR